MTLTDLETRTRHILDELNADQSHWSSIRIKEFLNEGYVDVATRLPAPLLPGLQDKLQHHLSIGITEYAMPTDFLKLWYIKAYGERAHIIDIKDETILDHNYFYNATTTHPLVVIYAEICTVSPTPTELINNGLQIHFIDVPAIMTGASESPKLLSWCHGWLAEFAAYRCLKEDDDPRYKDEYEKYITHFGKGVDGG